MAYKILIDGEEREVDPRAVLVIHDPEGERLTVAADMAEWGCYLAEAIKNESMAETAVDNWEGSTLSGMVKEGGEKGPAEWKAKAMLRGSPDYRTIKEQHAQAKQDLAICKAMFESYKVKAEILNGMNYREGQEERKAGMIGQTAPEEPVVRSSADDPRVAAAAASIRKTKLQNQPVKAK